MNCNLLGLRNERATTMKLKSRLLGSTAMLTVLPPVVVTRNTILHALSVNTYDLIKAMMIEAKERKLAKLAANKSIKGLINGTY